MVRGTTGAVTVGGWEEGEDAGADGTVDRIGTGGTEVLVGEDTWGR
jgi:hypothetical protein